MPQDAAPWGIDNDYGPLSDVLLGKPEYFRWVEAGPLIGRTLANADKTGAKNLGGNLVALGNGEVLSMQGAEKLNADMRVLGFTVHAPDMSMFTLGGGGVHCLCQVLRRAPAEG